MWKVIISIPFFVLFCAIVHELGHFVGCKIKGRKVYEIRIPFLRWKEGKVSLTRKMDSCCIFYGKEKNLFIFLLGPLFSLVHAGCWLFLFLYYKSEILLCYLIIAAIAFVVNMIPAKNSDVQKIVEGLRKSNDN